MNFDPKETISEVRLHAELFIISFWTYWMLIGRQMQSKFMPEQHRWISNLTGCQLQILQQETF